MNFYDFCYNYLLKQTLERAKLEEGDLQKYFECNLYSRDCDFIERCRYKQLLRKEQECEELQIRENEAEEIIAELQAYKDVNEDFKTAWEELKAENDELKKIINEAKDGEK